MIRLKRGKIKGYFVHFDKETKVDDVINARQHKDVKFSDVKAAGT